MQETVVHRFVVFVLAFVTSASAAPPLDAARLARIERDLSVPICGVGYLDTRAAQLREIGRFDAAPYLEHMARQSYSGDKRYLSMLAAQLLGHEKRVSHRAALTRLVGSPALSGELRFEAARQLATAYRAPAGRKLLRAGLSASETQRRADAMSALFEIAAAADLDALAERAADRDHYVVDRFVSEVEARRAQRAALSARVRKLHASKRGDERARFAYALFRLGDARHVGEVEAFLSNRRGPASDDDLYQLAQMCHALAARGHAFALDAALHVSSLYAGSQTRAFHWYALSVFFERTEFSREQVQRLSQSDAARVIAAWWKQNRAALRFDGQRFR